MYYYHESSHDWVFIMIHFNQSWDDVTWYEIYSYCYSWLKHLKHIYILPGIKIVNNNSYWWFFHHAGFND
jgi:hypothetical protein